MPIVLSPVSSSAATRFVTLKGGLIVPVEAIQLALDLESRGATLSCENAQLLVDAPVGVLTSDDHRLITRWRFHLMAIVSYEAPGCVD